MEETKAPQPTHEEHVQTAHDTLANEIKISPFMVLFSIVVALAGWMTGFDTGYSGTVLQMAPFNRAFGHCAPGPGGRLVCRLSAIQQSVTFISSLFTALGCALSGLSCHFLGRKKTLQLGCIIVCIGAAGQLGTSNSYTNFMVCKCIAAVGIGPFSVAGPMYGIESTAPRRRGALFALYGIGLSGGSLVIAAVCLGSNAFKDNWAWKTPIACQIPISVSYIGILTLFPESPRWLLIKGRTEEAGKAFGKFYGLEPHSNIVTAQIEDTQSSIFLEAEVRSTTSWIELFQESYIRRSLISVLVLSASALSGIWFIAPYAAVFFADVGIKNPFYSNLAFQACVFGGAIVSPFIVERFGRRAAILVGYSVMASCMLLVSSVSSGLGIASFTVQQVLIAFLCIWGFTFGASVSANSWLAGNEVHSIRLRAYGQGFAALIGQIIAFACEFWTPYMLSAEYGNMGTNVGYFYCGITVVCIMLVFFMLPETARLSLEQVDDIFVSKKRPWQTSVARNKRIARGEVHDLSNEERYAKIQELEHAKVTVA